MNRRQRRRGKSLERKVKRPGSMAGTDAVFDRALAHHEAGRHGEAEVLLERLIAADPSHADAHNLLGVVRAVVGKLEAAASLIARAIEIAPTVARYHNNLGNVKGALDRRDEAFACYRRALELEPGDAQALNNMGTLLRRLGRIDEARQVYERSLAVRPDNAETHSNHGNVLMDLGFLDAAAAAHRRALRLKPDYAVAHNNLGTVLRRLGRYADATLCFRRAIELDPDYADAFSNLGENLREQGEAADALACYRRALELEPDRPGIHSNLLLAMNCVAGLGREAVFAEHRAWARRHARSLIGGGAPHANLRDPERRLRVGYVSPDFRRHSVAYFIEPVIEGHDRRRVEVFAYASVGAGDEVTARLRAKADAWRPIEAMSDAAAAELVRRDAIDILVDLSGHTGGGRLLMFARRPAPLQLTWIGYPNTTGLDAMDVRLTDAWADPEGSEAFHAETLVRLTGGFLCYRPPEDAPPPARAGDGFVFASCNNLAKLTDGAVAAWAEILAQVPDARLLIKAKALADDAVRARVAARFARHGIAGDRLDLMGWVMGASHLAVYHLIDVALDTFPYNGATTTCEALWMGVPVVTLAGDRHAGRVGASLLKRLGLNDLVADDVASYVAMAVALAGDGERRSVLRASLRTRMLNRGVTDPVAFTAGLEAVYRGLWRVWCA